MSDDIHRRTALQCLGVAPLLGAVDHFESRPTVQWQFAADGELLLSDYRSRHDETLLVGGDGAIYALELSDGTLRWSFSPTVDRGDILPVVVGGTVLVLQRAAVNVLTPAGTHQRQLALDSTGAPSFANTDDIAFVGGGGIYAIDAASGETRWETESGEFDDVRALYARSDSVYAVTEDAVHSISTKTGRIRWQKSVKDTVGPTRVGITDGTLLVKDHRNVFAFGVADGQHQWQFRSDDLSHSYFGEKAVYVWDSQKLYALDGRKGTTKWAFDAGEYAVSPLSKRGGAVVCATSAAVYSLDGVTGEIKWRFSRTRGDGPFLSTVAGDTIYVRDGGTMGALDVDTGTGRWHFTPERGRPVTMQRVEDTVLVITDEGTLYAVGEPLRGPVEPLVGTSLSAVKEELPMVGLFGVISALLALKSYQRRSAQPDSTPNDFEVVEQLGTDGDTELYRVRLSDGREAVVKQLADEKLRKRFRNAIDTVATLDHEGIPEVLDRDDSPSMWVGIPYYEGESLASEYEKLTLRDGIRTIACACETVHAAHQSGIAHGQLGPERIRFAVEPRAESVRVDGWLSPSIRTQHAPKEAFDVAVSEDVLQLGGMARWFVSAKEGAETSIHRNRIRDILATATVTNAEERYASSLALADMLRWAVRQ